MPSNASRFSAFVAFLLCAWSAVAQPPAAQLPAAQLPAAQPPAAPAGSPWEELIATRGEALVPVRFVLSVSFGGAAGGDQETESELTGVVIDPAGLVLVSNTMLGGMVGLVERLMGGMGGFDIDATPRRIEVLATTGGEWLPARLVARDTELDLAWLKVEAPADRAFSYVDFGAAGEPRIGDDFVVVRRLDRLFDRAPAVIEGRIGGRAAKPRPLWVPASTLVGALGLPVFDSAGRPIGVTVLQLPEPQGGGHGSPLSFIGQGLRMQEMLSGLVLPAAEVTRATALARDMLDQPEPGGEPGAPAE